MSEPVRRRNPALGALSLTPSLFGIPAIVLTGELLIISEVLAIVAAMAGLLAMSSRAPAVKALSIAGFVLGAVTLWYVITSLVVGWSIATTLESLF